MGEVRKFWADVAAKTHVPDPSSTHYFRATRLFDATTALNVGDVVLRKCGSSEASYLADALLRRNVFARHGRHNDKYVQRASRFGGESIIQAILGPATVPEAAREIANRAECLVFVATSYLAPAAEAAQASDPRAVA